MTKETTTVCDQQPEPQEARDREAVPYRLIEDPPCGAPGRDAARSHFPEDPPFEGREELLAEAAREAGRSPDAAHAQALALLRADRPARPQGD